MKTITSEIIIFLKTSKKQTKKRKRKERKKERKVKTYNSQQIEFTKLQFNLTT